MTKYLSWPKGYDALTRDILPWYLRPAKKMLMRTLLMILADG